MILRLCSCVLISCVPSCCVLSYLVRARIVVACCAGNIKRCAHTSTATVCTYSFFLTCMCVRDTHPSNSRQSEYSTQISTSWQGKAFGQLSQMTKKQQGDALAKATAKTASGGYMPSTTPTIQDVALTLTTLTNAQTHAHAHTHGRCDIHPQPHFVILWRITTTVVFCR